MSARYLHWLIEYRHPDDDTWVRYAEAYSEEATKVVLAEMREATRYPWRVSRVDTTITEEEF